MLKLILKNFNVDADFPRININRQSLRVQREARHNLIAPPFFNIVSLGITQICQKVVKESSEMAQNIAYHPKMRRLACCWLPT